MIYLPRIESDFEIPEGVTHISAGILSNAIVSTTSRDSNVKIIIPPSVRSIQPGAFYDVKLVQIKPGNKVFYQDKYGAVINRKNGDFLFMSPAVIFGDYNIPEGVKYIAPQAFVFCNISGKVNIPEGVVGIGGEAFWNSSITNINIPASVSRIDNSAFFGTPLQSVTFAPRKASSNLRISQGAFGCRDLKTLRIPANAEIHPNAVRKGCKIIRE